MKRFLPLLVTVLFIQFSVAQNSPVANNDTFTINKNNSVILPVLSNDYDIDGDSLTLSILISPLHGTASDSGNRITYLPNFNYVGSDSLTYVICDTSSRCDTAIAVVIILNANNAPVAVDDNYTVPPNITSTLPVNSNDYDPDGDALSITMLTSPTNGTASVNGTQVDYSPTASFFGTDSFVYVICDSNLCDTATVYIVVTGSNLPPAATDDNYTYNDTLSAAFLDVLANDNDPENNLLTLTQVLDMDANNNLGNMSIDSATNSLVFSRNSISCGTETFEYVVCDYSLCDTGTLTITITCPEDVFLTEGFSPDGDGINDKLIFTRLEYFTPAVLKVFNRYGTLVYDNIDYKNDWDGTHLESGKALPDGTYFYILELVDKRKYNNYLIINR